MKKVKVSDALVWMFIAFLAYKVFMNVSHNIKSTKSTEYFITQEAYNAIVKISLASPDAEVGGLLGGKGNVIYMANTMENIAKNKVKSANFTGAIYAEKEINNKGYYVLGHWHSHVVGPASPSYEDAYEEGDFWPSKVFFIFSLDENKATMWRYPSKEELDGQPEKLTVQPLKFTVITDTPEAVTVTKDQ